MISLKKTSRGFSLIEILVTLLILAVGLMGLAALQSKMLNAEFEAYQRAQAIMLVQDMVDRIRTNPSAARNGDYSGGGPYGTDSSVGDSACSTADPVGFDLCSWSAALKGASVKSADDVSIGTVIGARGCIESVSGSSTSEIVLRVSVAWQGLAPTVSPGVTCGQGSYGADDSMRRVVSVLVTLGYLGV